MKNVVIALYDFTGVGVLPWAEAGYECYCYDEQHSSASPEVRRFESGGSISFLNVNLHDRANLSEIVAAFTGRVFFMMAYPVCTNLAVSGSAHFATKKEGSPLLQEIDTDHLRWAEKVGVALGCPFFVENPVSVASSLWRKPDFMFDPCDFGGYISDSNLDHPLYPDVIPPRDAYTKKTCLWAGGGFVMPEKRPVEPVTHKGRNPLDAKLGGKSQRTKNIRSATPRGFGLAVFAAYGLRKSRKKELLS